MRCVDLRNILAKMKKDRPTKSSLKAQEYEQLGRMIEAVYVSGYANKKRLYLISFAKGVFIGLGGTVGVAIVLAIVTAILSIFDFVPFVDTIEKTIGNSY